MSASIFENVPKRTCNNYQPQSPIELVNVPNPQAPPVVYINATDLVRTMAAMMAEKRSTRNQEILLNILRNMGRAIFMVR